MAIKYDRPANLENLTIRIDPKMRKALEIQARKEAKAYPGVNITVSNIVRRALLSYIYGTKAK